MPVDWQLSASIKWETPQKNILGTPMLGRAVPIRRFRRAESTIVSCLQGKIMQLFEKTRAQPSAGSYHHIIAAAFMLPTICFLCGFMKPQLPETIYDGTRYSALIETYKRAYAQVGMTKMKVITEAQTEAPDGTVSSVRAYSFSCPSSSMRHEEPCGTTFSISAAVKDDVCHDCRVTRTSYSGDRANDEKAVAEIRRVLGKSPPAN